MTPTLVITADDLGMDPRRDDGILEAFAGGAITQASLLVRGPSAEQAAARARSAGLPLGLHLDLTETPASAPAARIASLLDGAGNKLGKHGLRAARHRLVPDHLEAEAAAQLDRFAALTGAPARHLDGHQHVHTMPEVARVLAPLLRRRGVATVRIPEQRALEVADAGTRDFYLQVSHEGAAARAVYLDEGVASTAGFLGLDLMGFALLPGPLLAALAAQQAASCELMCHPGHAGAGGDDFNRSPAREHELSVLLGLPFAPLVRAGRLRLGTFFDLVAPAGDHQRGP